MEFNDLSEKEQKLVVSCKYDLFRDKAIKLKEKGIDNCIYDFDFDLISLSAFISAFLSAAFFF